MPRFERLWQRQGLGRFDGAAHAGMYYVVANDGWSVHAVEVASGKTVWRTELATPWKDWGRTRIAGDAVMLLYPAPGGPRGSSDSVVVQLSAVDGRIRWSKMFGCDAADSRAAAGRLYLLCQTGGAFHEIRELEPSSGTERSEISVFDDFDIASDDRVCGTSSVETWCGKIDGSRVAIDWKQPGKGRRFEIAGKYVIRAGDQLVVHRATDGSVLWRQPAGMWFFADATHGRLLSIRGGALDVLRLDDGRRLLDVPMAAMIGAKFRSDGERLVVIPHGDPKSVYLIDASSQVRTIARNLTFFDEATSGVLLSRNVGPSGLYQDTAPLVAYSLVKFLSPESSLDPSHRVVAVLERFPLPYQAMQALVELRSIPGAMAALEEVLRIGPTDLRPAAAAIAARTRDPRFVGVLRAHLEALTKLPASREDRTLLNEIVDALSQLDSPEAPAALLKFWRRLGQSAPASAERTYLRDTVAASIWRFGAHKDWVSCRDTTFPVGSSAPAHASLGTPSPGVEYEVDPQRQWAAICEAREDTDGSGALTVWTYMHGQTDGDQLQPYLVLRSGPGTDIDDFVNSDPGGRWIVVIRSFCVHLVDARTGTSIALPGADGRPGDTHAGSHRAASFSPDGTKLVYIRSDGARAQVVQRDLSSGSERILEPGPGELSQAFFEPGGRFVVMDVVTTDTNGDGRLDAPQLSTTLASRRCRASAITASSYGMTGDRPIQRIAAVQGDVTVTDAPAGTVLRPAPPVAPPYELVASSRAPESDSSFRSALPLGPFHWQERP